MGGRSGGRGSKGKAAVEGGGPCNVSATNGPATAQNQRKNVLKLDQNKVNLVFRNAPEKLTFDELDHFLVGHGGNERAVHLTDGGADCQRCGKTTKRVRFGVGERESPL